jgi:hypothetical protein
VKIRFQNLSFKCNLQRYSTDAADVADAAGTAAAIAHDEKSDAAATSSRGEFIPDEQYEESIRMLHEERVSLMAARARVKEDALMVGLYKFMVYGLWFMVYGLWFMVYGLWFMVYGLWFMVYGLWFMLYALCFMLYASCFKV